MIYDTVILIDMLMQIMLHVYNSYNYDYKYDSVMQIYTQAVLQQIKYKTMLWWFRGCHEAIYLLLLYH